MILQDKQREFLDYIVSRDYALTDGEANVVKRVLRRNEYRQSDKNALNNIRFIFAAMFIDDKNEHIEMY